MKRRNFIKNVMATSLAVATILFGEEVDEELVEHPNRLSFEDAVEAILYDEDVCYEKIEYAGKVELLVPEIAENGMVTPVKVFVDYPMDAECYVKSIHLLKTKDLNARCASVLLTPQNGNAKFATRIKLSGSQNVVALIIFSDSTFIKIGKKVRVTIGRCCFC